MAANKQVIQNNFKTIRYGRSFGGEVSADVATLPYATVTLRAGRQIICFGVKHLDEVTEALTFLRDEYNKEMK